MISKKDVLGIVVEKHGIIIADDDPILSVLAVSDAIYDIYTKRLSEQMEILLVKNTKLFSQRASSLQSAAAEAARQISDENRREVNRILENSRTDWQSAFALAHDKNQSVISELKRIRTQILLGFGATLSALALFSIVFWTRGV